jgi:hypothetical protein
VACALAGELQVSRVSLERTRERVGSGLGTFDFQPCAGDDNRRARFGNHFQRRKKCEGTGGVARLQAISSALTDQARIVRVPRQRLLQHGEGQVLVADGGMCPCG